MSQWLEYRTKYGHEPKRETDDENIAVWASKVRAKWERKQKGQKTNLTDGQIELLSKWGFQWQIESKFQPKSKPLETKSWQERFDDLVAYKEEHGK